jgi:hypothetical protein
MVDRQRCLVGLHGHTKPRQAEARDRWSELIVELRRVGGRVSGHGGCDGGQKYFKNMQRGCTSGAA